MLKCLFTFLMTSEMWMVVKCVCVWGGVLVIPTLWGQKVPTKMAISKIIVLVGTVFGLHEETS